MYNSHILSYLDIRQEPAGADAGEGIRERVGVGGRGGEAGDGDVVDGGGNVDTWRFLKG